MKLLILHGPNMNLIGIRSAKKKERITLDKINRHIRKFIRNLDIEVKIIQTHNEIKAVSYLHKNRNKFDGLILTPGVWKKSGYILEETLDIISINFVIINQNNNKGKHIFSDKKNIFNNNILESFEQAILSYVSK